MKESSTGQEVELKRLLVGDSAAEKLIGLLGAVAADKRQLNHVFDTADGRLRRQRYSVRLRFEDGCPILTAKGPGRRVSGDTAVRDEAEATIDERLARDILAGARDPVQVLRQRVPAGAFEPLWRGLAEARGGLPLETMGAFENRRRVVPVRLPSGVALEVEIDRTRFPDGHEDDEVEIELPSHELAAEVEDWLAARASEAGVATAPATPKVARFYARRSEPPARADDGD